ncbi:MAG: hypothetical protein PHE30_02935 [Candidatus Omnitrophica bacterium]|nr:hypothetical protein [Candidatus Omnitrophota bacterium]MDD5661835.1 hypothetical protein [Candidatus Omnitrophota bacterium]
MAKKENIVIEITVLILAIAVGIAYQNFQNAKESRKQIDELNSVIHEKNTQIIKLIKDIKKR